MQYVVFGINGYIGSYIFNCLKRDNYNVLGTSRRTDIQDKVVIYDIQKDDIDNVLIKMEEAERIAIICIAEPNIDRCFEKYDWAYEINVVRTKKLIHELIINGFQVIYFSSDNVFDGASGNYTEESDTNAINKYGMMKEEMERYLLLNEPEVCIMRIPKVVSTFEAKQNVFTEWSERAKTGVIRCIRGNQIAFVDIDDIYYACIIVAKNKLHGLYNVVGDIAYSRAELARKFCDRLGLAQVDIQECDVNEFPFKDSRPLNIGMSNLKFKKETGYKFKAMDAVIDKYISVISKKE